MSDEARSRALKIATTSDDLEKLDRLARNARRLGDGEVERTALMRLYDVLPSAKPGTLEHDVWRSVHRLEGALSRERDKTTRLSRTRQKITRDGELKTVQDLILGKSTDGFDMLVARDMMDLTFEAVALRHSDRFEDAVVQAAKQRLALVEAPPTPGQRVRL